jgi:hypothetical protein
LHHDEGILVVQGEGAALGDFADDLMAGRRAYP